jgi:predicted methyltransferase
MDPDRHRGLTLRAALLLGALGLVWLGRVSARDDWDERDRWQRPAEVMDRLGIGPGAVVADVGSGDGYFTFRIAERVGPEGRVYAVDIKKDVLEKIDRRADRERRANIRTIPGSADDPHLPEAALDVAIMVNAYHEMRDYAAMLDAVRRALKPGGRLAIIDHEGRPGQTRRSYQDRHRIAPEVVIDDARARGFSLREQAPGFHRPRYGGQDWFFLVFEKETR